MTIFLDTHVVIWLKECNDRRLSRTAQKLISQSPALHYSAMTWLELAYLREAGKALHGPDEILGALEKEIPLSMADSSFARLCKEAENITWTRDVFDRLIVAEAALYNAPLVTADRNIRKHYAKAVW